MDEEPHEENDHHHDHGETVQHEARLDAERSVGEPSPERNGEDPVVGPGQHLRHQGEGRRQRESHRADGNGGNGPIAPGRSQQPVGKSPQSGKGGKDPDGFGRHGVILSGG